MKKALLGILIILITTAAWFDFCQAQGGTGTMSKIEGKKILFVIASQNFRDEEFRFPKEMLEAQGAKITVASSSLSEAKGMLGMKAKIDILIDQVRVNDFDGVVFVGGGGAREYFNHSIAHKVAKDAFQQDKVLAAICIAPVTLANAGLLNGKRATVFSSEIETIKNKGAIYTGKNIERDGKIITADGPRSAKDFAKALINVLAE